VGGSISCSLLGGVVERPDEERGDARKHRTCQLKERVQQCKASPPLIPASPLIIAQTVITSEAPYDTTSIASAGKKMPVPSYVGTTIICLHGVEAKIVLFAKYN
jgi:hypothetical protein